MKTFTLDNDNNISAFATAAEAAAATPTPFDSFASEKEFAELVAGFPAERWRGLWNCWPGVTPVQGFRSPKPRPAASGRGFRDWAAPRNLRPNSAPSPGSKRRRRVAHTRPRQRGRKQGRPGRRGPMFLAGVRPRLGGYPVAPAYGPDRGWN
jgi:hypothetical protein